MLRRWPLAVTSTMTTAASAAMLGEGRMIKSQREK
jgi:hypothetical protein